MNFSRIHSLTACCSTMIQSRNGAIHVYLTLTSNKGRSLRCSCSNDSNYPKAIANVLYCANSHSLWLSINFQNTFTLLFSFIKCVSTNFFFTLKISTLWFFTPVNRVHLYALAHTYNGIFHIRRWFWSKKMPVEFQPCFTWTNGAKKKKKRAPCLCCTFSPLESVS